MSQHTAPRSFPQAFGRRTDRFQESETPTRYPGAFQQKKRDEPYAQRSSGGGSYREWKQAKKEAEPIRIESTEQFPTLGSNVIAKTETKPAGTSLAEKLKLAIQQEQEEATQRRYKKEIDRDDGHIVIPLSMSSFARSKAEQKRQEDERRARSIADYDQRDDEEDDMEEENMEDDQQDME